MDRRLNLGWLAAATAGLMLTGCFQGFPALQKNLQQITPGMRSFSSGFDLQTRNLPFGNTADNMARIKQKPYTGSFRFALIGDNRNSSPFSGNGNKIYAEVLKKVNALNPDFVVNVGDFTFDSLPRHWKDFEKVTSGVRVPYLTVVGNHDVIFKRNYYESRYTPANPETGLDDYSFDYGNARFIMLDNANRTITDRQFQWLEKMTQTPLKTFVFAHIPPGYKEWKHSLSPSDNVSERWMQLNEKNGVDFVLLGHIHLFDAKTVNNVQYVVSGGAGSPLDKGSGFGRAFYHVVMLEVKGDQISYNAVPVEVKEESKGPTGFGSGLDAVQIDQLLPPQEQVPHEETYSFHQHR